ncbi:right-handed parallel beta-helix repeat-containing protein [Enorma phocaeensis]|uniref:right-handed parallel beta-helix repeat-containing protein n=1 Tax=Enorma phocaeensis TaxID=1871019 RepID=UPI001EF4AB89|nr:right-handed parallel beta-helix repeat-containing protein [Enorma phocaeensis]
MEKVSSESPVDISASGTLTADSSVSIPENADVTITFADDAAIDRGQSDDKDDSPTFIVAKGARLTITGSVTVNGDTGMFVQVAEGGSLTLNGSIAADEVNGEESFIDVAGSLTLNANGSVSGWKGVEDGASAVEASGENASITVNGGSITDNSGTSRGGVQVLKGATMTMEGGSVTNNRLTGGNSYSYGAGIYLSGGSTLTAEGAAITDNCGKYEGDWSRRQQAGGGIAVTGVGSTVTLTNCKVERNRVANNSGWAGGGIYAANKARVTVTGGSISNNSAFTSDDHTQHESGGGGVYATGDAVVSLTDVTINGNTALLGAGLYLNGVAGARIEDCTVSGNMTLRDSSPSEPYSNSSVGGGILARTSGGGLTPPGGGSDAEPTGIQIVDTTVSGNTATQGGGGVCVLGGDVAMRNVKVTGNDAPQGGGMWIQGSSDVTLDNCTVGSNEASAAGGGIGAGAGELTLTETSVSENTAGEAGGIYNGGADITLVSGSIANNIALRAGGVENVGAFTQEGGDITGNQATAEEGQSEDQALAGGVANITGTYTMEGGRIFGNTAAYGANDFYNYAEPTEEGGDEGQGGGIDVDDSWEGDHDMGLDSVGGETRPGLAAAPAPRANEHGTFTLIDPSGFILGVDGWYEDKPDARYKDTDEADRVKYEIVENDTSEQYLTLGEPVIAGTLTLEPRDMVAYTGGDSMDNDNFPEVRYRVSADDDLSKALDEGDVGLALLVDGDSVSLDAEDATVGDGTIVIPELDAAFSLEEGSAADDDEVAGVYDVVISDDDVAATLSDGRLVNVKVATSDEEPATLTVRTVSNASEAAGEEGTADVVAANPVIVGETATGEQDSALATATVAAGATFFTNGDDSMGLLGIDGADPDSGAQVSLLFDDLLPVENGTTADTEALLAKHAGIDASSTEFKYLDLVNEHDGNVWVSTDSDITISWPVPEGVDPSNVTFAVHHFKGLHREYGGAGSPDAADQIAKSEVEVIPCSVVDGRVVFTLDGDVEDGSFSPFALTWTKASDPGGDTPDRPPVNPGGDDDPDTPDTPDTPVDPEDPDTPDTPDEPDSPEDPDTPDAPVTPETPEEPQDPNVPEDPQDSSGSTDHILPSTGDVAPIVVLIAAVGGAAALVGSARMRRKR